MIDADAALAGTARAVTTSAPPVAPGACVAVGTAGRDAIAVAGHRQVFRTGGSLATPLPMTAATSHDLGSLTKIVGTTAALMRLVDTGALHVDTPAYRLLPRLSTTLGERVTVADLLRHRAGLWEWWPTYLGADTPDAAIDAVLRLAPRYRPGTARHYSDLGFMLLGRIVEVATGSRLPDAVRDLVLDPLGLRHTRYGGPAGTGGTDRPDVAGTADVAASSRGDAIERRMVATGEPYPVPVSGAGFGWRTHMLVGEVNDGNAHHAFGGAAGHAGLFSTAADLLRFGRSLLAGLAGDGMISPGTLRAFLAAGPDPEQALGPRIWWTGVDGCRVAAYGHTGFPGTAFAVLPAHDATVVLLTNRLHVPGEPVRVDAAWAATLDACHRYLHATPAPRDEPHRHPDQD